MAITNKAKIFVGLMLTGILLFPVLSHAETRGDWTLSKESVDQKKDGIITEYAPWHMTRGGETQEVYCINADRQFNLILDNYDDELEAYKEFKYFELSEEDITDFDDVYRGQPFISEGYKHNSKSLEAVRCALYLAEQHGKDKAPTFHNTQSSFYMYLGLPTASLDQFFKRVPDNYHVKFYVWDGYYQDEDMNPEEIHAVEWYPQIFVRSYYADEKDVIISKTILGQGKELSGATLSITENGKKISQWVTDGTEHKVKLPAGSYTLTETSCPDGFLKAESIDFTVSDDGILINGNPVDKVIMEDDYTKVKISKKDITNNDEIGGARLSVSDKNGNIIEEWTSVEGESHYINAKLKAGETYILTETMSPEGYAVAESIEFKVNEDGVEQIVNMYDEPMPEDPGDDTPEESTTEELGDDTPKEPDITGSAKNTAERAEEPKASEAAITEDIDKTKSPEVVDTTKTSEGQNISDAVNNSDTKTPEETVSKTTENTKSETSSAKNKTSPNTGDTNSIVFPMTAFFLAAIMLINLKRKEN